MLTYNTEATQICQDSSNRKNDCFWRKMNDKETQEENCFCLSDCSLSKYHQVDSIIPLSDDCSIGHYIEEYGVYVDEVGDYIGREMDWYKKLSK